MFDALSSYAADIETDTNEQADGQRYGLEPLKSGITEIAFSCDTSVMSEGGTVFATDDGMAEADVIIGFDQMLYELDPGVLFTWNGSFFDLPFILTRSEILGITQHMHLHAQPGLKPKYTPTAPHTGGYSATWGTKGVMPHQHFDIMRAYERAAKLLDAKWSLKPVAEAYGLEMINVDRERMDLLTPAERRAYALSDSSGTRKLGMHHMGLEVPEITDPILELAWMYQDLND